MYVTKCYRGPWIWAKSLAQQGKDKFGNLRLRGNIRVTLKWVFKSWDIVWLKLAEDTIR